MGKLLSIVIPVYNVEQYIERALKSLINQSYNKFQLIIVNDGSTDLSMEIVNKYKQSFSDINIVNQQNSGVSAARNAGLSLCEGKYVLFLDSDDFYDVQMLEHLIEVAEKENADIVSCKYRIIEEGIGFKDFEVGTTTNEIKTLENDTLIKEFLLHRNIDGYVWNKLFRISFLRDNNLRFVEGKVYEDTLMIFDVLIKRPKLVLSNKILYNYVKRKGSLITRNDNKSVSDLLDNINLISDKLHEFNLLNSLKTEFEYNSMLVYMQALILLQRLTVKTQEDALLAKSLLKKLNYNNKYLSKRDKIYIFMLKNNLLKLYIKLLKK